jgi:predicted amidohydrolase
MVIDPLGATLYAKAGDEDVFTITLKKDDLAGIRGKFPFWRDGDNFIILGNES